MRGESREVGDPGEKRPEEEKVSRRNRIWSAGSTVTQCTKMVLKGE